MDKTVKDFKDNLKDEMLKCLVDNLCEKYHINEDAEMGTYPFIAGAYTDQGEWLSLWRIFETIQETDEQYEE